MNQQLKLVLITIGITLVGIFGISALFSNSSNTATEPTEVADTSVLIRDDSPSKGSKDAKVTIVEFLDPECEACKAAHPLVKKVLSDNPDSVRLVVRYFPLHGNSVLAARATELAGEQGKYWEMQDKLFENQTIWGEKKEPQTVLFIQYAQELGLNVETFTEALNGTKYTDKVQRDKIDGQTLDVNGTPTFFVNGKKVQNIGSLSTIVQEELKK